MECSKKHLDCPSVTLSGVTMRLNERVSSYQDFVRKAFQIEDQFIRSIEKKRNELTSKFYLSNFEQKYIDTIKEIYKEKDSNLKGQDGK